ncbi:ABC transporter substrate-binding protein [bacterium]|nr:ABC transporter substrate-binding protein [bacterium]
MMMKTLKLLFLLLLVLTSSLVHAGEEVLDGKMFINNFLNEIKNISQLSAPDSEKFMGTYYDTQLMLDRAAVDFKDELTARQKKEFYNLFDLLLKKKISQQGSNWNQYFKNCIVDSVKMESSGEKVVVRSILEKGKALNMTFILVKGLKGYKIVDLDVDGALLSRNFRSQFSRIFSEEGYKGLYGRLTARLNEATL